MGRSRLYCPEEKFTWRLLSRLPMNIGFSFTLEQLEALRTAFGTRFEGRHALDLRSRLYLPWSRYYLVVQCGRDRRDDLEPSQPVARLRTVLDSMLRGLALGGALSALVWLATQGV